MSCYELTGKFSSGDIDRFAPIIFAICAVNSIKKMLKFSSDLCLKTPKVATPMFLFGTEQSLKFLMANSFFFS